MKRAIAWILVVVLGAVAVSGWYLYRNERNTSERLQRELTAYQNIRVESAQFTPARFVRADGTTITFGLPTQIRRGDELFIEYEEYEAELADPDAVYRAVGPALLSELTAGQELRLDLSHDPKDQNRYVIHAIYILD